MLTTKRPTETTVLYTVSTRSATTSITSKLATSISLSIRIIIGLITLACALLEYDRGINDGGAVRLLGEPLLIAIIPRILREIAMRYLFDAVLAPWRLALYLIAILLIFRRSHTEESLLVIRGLGVQTTTSSSNYLWTSATRFIPTNSVQDIFIHEAFKGFQVKYYLSIVVEGEEDVVVVFPSLLPQREILEQVWRGARACLYEPKSG